MYFAEELHLRHLADRIAVAERNLRRQGPRRPRPPGASRRALAAGLRALADSLAPASGAEPRGA